MNLSPQDPQFSHGEIDVCGLVHTRIWLSEFFSLDSLFHSFFSGWKGVPGTQWPLEPVLGALGGGGGGGGGQEIHQLMMIDDHSQITLSQCVARASSIFSYVASPFLQFLTGKASSCCL